MSGTNKPRTNNERNLFWRKLLVFLWPFRETLGGTFAGVNFKFGELAELFYCLKMLPEKAFKVTSKNLQRILICLVINLLLCLFASIIQFNCIDKTFFIKFFAKNFLVLLFLYLVITRRFTFGKSEIDSLMKFIVILEAAFWILQVAFHIRISELRIIHTDNDWTGLSANGLKIPRFSGTASEPGYLPVILAPAVYFFSINHKKHPIYCIISYFLMISTLSSFAFITLFIILVCVFIRSKKSEFLAFFLPVIVVCITLIAAVHPLRSLASYYFEKAVSYLNFTSTTFSNGDWSAADRSQNIRFALALFSQGSVFQKLFGYGTGGYSFWHGLNSSMVISGVEEAYNIYLSTLTDRGIIGLLNLVVLFYSLLKIPSRDVQSRSLKVGMLVQMTHYILVGNLWLYFFWQEAAFLIGYNRELFEESRALPIRTGFMRQSFDKGFSRI